MSLQQTMTLACANTGERTAEPQMETNEPSREDVFEGLVHRTWQRAYWTALDIVGDPATAEDLCQEALIRAYERWDEFRHQAAPDTWLYRILVNLCLNHRRRRGIWSRISQTLRLDAERDADWQSHAPLLNPEQQLRDRETVEAIHKAMEALSVNQRTAFALRYLQGFSVTEVADVTGWASGTVKSHLFRALRTMRKTLQTSEFDGLLDEK